MVRPFHVQQEVMNAIRPMRRSDIARVAQLHAAAMGNSLWATLGESFLRKIYISMLKSSHFLGFVYEESGTIEGFIAGSTDLSKMMSEIAKRDGFRLGLSALWGLRKVRTLFRLLSTARYFTASQQEVAEDITAESMFCSFTPRTRGKKISGHINKVLFDTLYFKGHQYVKITTEIDNQGANRQLKSWGFQERGTFTFYGKEMICYTLDLSASTRVQKYNWSTS